MRYCKKSYFDVTYRFGCKKFNSAPFLLKISENEAYLQGVSVAILNRLQLVFIGPVQSSFSSVFFFKKTELQLVRFGFFGLVWSGFDLFPVHRTGPSNPNHMEIYKPCMDGLAPPGAGVADTIGTFTMTIRVAQDMFLASLPCWLIQSSSMFSDKKIFSIAEIFSPKDYIILEPHKHNYPIIFKGPATNFEKYRAIEIFTRISCVAEIHLQWHVPPRARHWPELPSLLAHPHSLLPHPPLQLLPPVQLNIWLDETLGGLFVSLQGDVELVSLQHSIYWYIIILYC